MKLSLDLEVCKQVSFLSIPVAKLQGDVDLDVVAETFTRGRVKKKIIKALSDSELRGRVEIDGEQIKIG